MAQTSTFNRIAFKVVRERTGLSLRQLADSSGVSFSMIGMVERGESVPSFQTISKLAEAMAVPVATFLTAEEVTA